MNTAKTRARPHHASDPVTCSCHQGVFDPGVSEWQPRLYRVQVEDEQGMVFSVTVTAIGKFDAANQARLDYPDCFVRQAVPA
jgi:hypothetical protein